MNNYYIYQSSIGSITMGANEKSITHLLFGERTIKGYELGETELLKKAYTELLEYLEGKRRSFDLPLEPQGTDFQKSVWSALRRIPYGEKVSYKYIAESIGNERACRAVGNANNKNPIAIFIPCHRVVGASGKLVGYAGGLDTKQRLIEIETSEN